MRKREGVIMNNFILAIFAILQMICLQANDFTTTLFSQYQNIPVLVTGGCGFIGSHLVEKLVESGAHVTILDNLSSGKKENIEAVKDKVLFIPGDITDFETCLHATKNQHIVFHLAAFLSVPGSMENPLSCHNINVIGTQNILEAARINNVTRFVFSSTCATYGESPYECREDDKLAPASVYGFSKLIGETYCKEYAQIFNMETVIMRYFNVYGPRQNPHGSYAGVIAKFSYNMEHDLPIIIFGDGTQTRDYVPVDNVVTANLFLGICDKSYINSEVFNIGTGKSISILELIDILKKQYPYYQKDPIFMPARPGDVKYIIADCSKYNELYNSAINTMEKKCVNIY
jgi:nucleoside-diphosphate-sugar epimerase